MHHVGRRHLPVSSDHVEDWRCMMVDQEEELVGNAIDERLDWLQGLGVINRKGFSGARYLSLRARL